MLRVIIELVEGRVVQAHTNCGAVELMLVDHDARAGYVVVAQHRPDLTDKDQRVVEPRA